MIEIDKNTPMPPVTVGRPRQYPFAELQVGDSFAIPLAGIMLRSGDKAVGRLSAAALAYSRRYGGKFTVRTDRENNVARCWRVQ
jgi:hypothetical protein